MATESIADLRRQLEFGNASVQARVRNSIHCRRLVLSFQAFTAVVDLITNGKSESVKAERVR